MAERAAFTIAASSTSVLAIEIDSRRVRHRQWQHRKAQSTARKHMFSVGQFGHETGTLPPFTAVHRHAPEGEATHHALAALAGQQQHHQPTRLQELEQVTSLLRDPHSDRSN